MADKSPETKEDLARRRREYFVQPADGVVVLKPGVKPDGPVPVVPELPIQPPLGSEPHDL